MFYCFVGKKTIDFITQCDAGKKSNGGNKIKTPSIIHNTDYRSAPSALYRPCSALLDFHIPLLHLKSALLSLISAQLGQKSDLSGFETVLKRYSKHHRPSTCYLRPHKIFEVRQIKVPSVL